MSHRFNCFTLTYTSFLPKYEQVPADPVGVWGLHSKGFRFGIVMWVCVLVYTRLFLPTVGFSYNL